MVDAQNEVKSAVIPKALPNKFIQELHHFVRTQGEEYLRDPRVRSTIERLDVLLSQPTTMEQPLSGNRGYNKSFLSAPVDLPELEAPNMEKAFIASGSEIMNYTHFSLALNKERRFAFWVAWNIDGGNLLKLGRRGLSFIFDPNIPENYQVGPQLYERDRLDQGHIARRADLIWGEPTEAAMANKDSFFFTNISPQMDNFNRSNLGGLWGRLEDAVYEETDVEDLKISVFGGPVFRDDDRGFRGVLIPREFWKVIVYVENQKLKAKAFLLTQNLDELEIFEFDQFKVYQVALTEIENRCGLKFSANLVSSDSMGEHLRSLVVTQRKPLASLKDIDWSS
jgi:endonuclease G, mitochondrial